MRPRVLAAPAILLGLAGCWLLATLSPPDRAAVLAVIWKRGWLPVVFFSGMLLAGLQSAVLSPVVCPQAGAQRRR